MTLYRLLHGAVWYAEGPLPRHTISLGGFADTLRWLPHIPKKWRRVVRRMLRDDPTLRYQDANQVVMALADLPIDPSWSCIVTASDVTWEREAKNRRIKVVWQRHSARRHEWKAWSEPLTVGRQRALGGSNGIYSRKQVVAALEGFFVQ